MLKIQSLRTKVLKWMLICLLCIVTVSAIGDSILRVVIVDDEHILVPNAGWFYFDPDSDAMLLRHSDYELVRP